jgi:benzoyl-CoA reductase/2-hydroxyglutaryl-CoA dehydratase subunit BcrC/BadD/HgdB
MIRKLSDLFEGSNDAPLEFDRRYRYGSRKPMQREQANLFSTWLSDNRRVINSLTSDGRPKAIAYFDRHLTTDERLKELQRLKKSGTKLIGTFCNMVPDELIYAAGAVPIRLCSGCFEAVKPGEENFPRDCCSLIKAAVGFAVADQPYFSMCDAIIIPSTCDGKKKLGEVLDDYRPVWMLSLPHDKDRQVSKDSWQSEIRILKKRLENLTGNALGRRELREAIVRTRARYDIMRTLLELRKNDPSVISGTDALIVVQSAFSDDLERWVGHTRKLCTELEGRARQEQASDKRVRILLTGSPVIIPNFKIPLTIEHFDAVIAVDETCAGTQFLYDPVEVDEWTMSDMMRAISERYLMPSVCPCFIKSEDRIDRLLELKNAYRIDGIISHTQRLCLLFDVESMKVRRVMEEQGIPFLSVNTDYSREDLGQLRTRIEAFIEILHTRK